MNNAEVLHDFRRRWENTYVWLNIENKDEELVYLSRVEDNSDKVGKLYLTSDRLGELVLNFGSEGYALQFRYPPVGVFQHNRDAYCFYRRPIRQYRRGICGDNSLLMNTARNLTGNTARFGSGILKSAFAHQVFTWPEAIELLAGGIWRGVALSENFSLTQSMFKSPDYVLFHWTHPIARVNTKGQITLFYEENYREWIHQLFNL